MKKLLVVLGAVVALAIPTVGIAASLQTSHIGSECKSSGLVKWHFVNNQTGGATGGTLTANFLINGQAVTLTDSNPKVLNSVLQFNVFTSGDATLVGANTGSVPGKLVLSDFCKK